MHTYNFLTLFLLCYICKLPTLFSVQFSLSVPSPGQQNKTEYKNTTLLIGFTLYQGVEPRGTHGALGFCREGKGLGQLDLGVDGSVCIAVARGRVDRKCALPGTERQRPRSVTCSRFSGADRGLAPRTQGHQCPGPSLTGLMQQVR